jgi:hypothetical protein
MQDTKKHCIQTNGFLYLRFSACLVTKLLQDSLGGNCLTRVLMCFSPSEDPQTVSAMFELAYFFCQVKNFPIINEVLSQVRARHFIIVSIK